jgi:hypothetical protein
MQACHVVVQRVDREAEGHVALVLGGAALQDQHAGRLRPLPNDPEEGALADSRLAEDGQHPSVATGRGCDRAPAQVELGLAAEE